MAKRIFTILLGVAVLVTATALLGMNFAARSLKADALRALGPQSQVSELKVGFTSVKISGVQVRAPLGWPVDKSLAAKEVVAVPDLRQLLQHHVYVTSLKIEGGYISAVRPASGGGLKVLPTMLGNDKQHKAEKKGGSADIHTVTLANCVVDLFDETVTGHKKLPAAWAHLPAWSARTATAAAVLSSCRVRKKARGAGPAWAGRGKACHPPLPCIRRFQPLPDNRSGILRSVWDRSCGCHTRMHPEKGLPVAHHHSAIHM